MTLGLAAPRRWLGPLLAVYWLAIFAATHLPQAALPPSTLGDKAEHFIAYGLLAVLLNLWLIHRFPRLPMPWLWTLCIAMAYGAIDELTQPIVNRHAALGDWIADATGAALGVLLVNTVLFAVARWRGRGRTGNIPSP